MTNYFYTAKGVEFATSGIKVKNCDIKAVVLNVITQQ